MVGGHSLLIVIIVLVLLFGVGGGGWYNGGAYRTYAWSGTGLVVLLLVLFLLGVI
jgi:hypothetical protein